MDFHVKQHEPMIQLKDGVFQCLFKSKEVPKWPVALLLANSTTLTVEPHWSNKYAQEQQLEINKFPFGEDTESLTLEINVLMDRDKSEIYWSMILYAQLLMLSNKMSSILITEIISDAKLSRIKKPVNTLSPNMFIQVLHDMM